MCLIKTKKIISKIIIASVIFGMIPATAKNAVNAQEADDIITLQLYNGDGSGLKKPDNQSDNACVIGESYSKCMQLTAKDALSDNVVSEDFPWVEYSVNADKSGYYSLTWSGIRYNLDKRSTSFWNLTINPGENEEIYEVNDINSKITEQNGYIASCDYTGRAVYLKKGLNKIRITDIESNSTSSNLRRTMIQQIKFVCINQVSEEEGRITLLMCNSSAELLPPINQSDNAYFFGESYTKCLQLTAMDESSDNIRTTDCPWIDYTIKADESRYYSLHWTGVRYNLDVRSTAFWSLTVNPGDGEKVYSINGANSEIKSESNLMADCDYVSEMVYLNKGINVIRIKNTDSNNKSQNVRRLMVRKIEFVKQINSDNLSAATVDDCIFQNTSSVIKFTDGDGMTFDSTYANIESIKYTSTDQSIAKVSDDGIVTGVGVGECKISITVKDKFGNSYDTSCDVTIYNRILVEGEKPNVMPNIGTIYSIKELSGGQVLHFGTNYPQNEPEAAFSAEYTVNVPKSGLYAIYVVGGKKGVYNRTDFSITVNGASTFSSLMDAETVENITTSTWNGTFVKHKMGTAAFNKGANTIKFTVDKNDISFIGNIISCFLDCIILEEDSFGINNVKGSELYNVYDYNETVDFTVLFKGKPTKDVELCYRIYDAFGTKPIKEDKVLTDKENYLLSLGKFNPGWYELEIFEAGKEDKAIKTSFSVVPDYTARIKGDSPFAADFGMTELSGSKELFEGLARAADLAGIHLARDRSCWQYIQKNSPKNINETVYDFSFLKSRFEIYKKYGIDVLNLSYAFPSGVSEEDLFSVYNFHKRLAEEFDGLSKAYEIFNETETENVYLTANDYSAILKAAAIGIKDAKPKYDPQILPAGMWQTPKDHYIDVLMDNGIGNYCDAIGFHVHSHETRDADGKLTGVGINEFSLTKSKEFEEKKMEFSEIAKPLWITEAGVFLEYPKDKNGQISGEISKEQRLNQASYAVKSNMQSIANGTSKHFWFLWNPYIENGAEMGTFTADYKPTPAYSALAQMTYILGNGKYKGVIDSESCEAYVLNSGKKDIVVAWADSDREIELLSDDDVTVTNLMGESRNVASVKGKVVVPVSTVPCYISFKNSVSPDDYYPVKYTNDEKNRVSFSEADKVVLRQEFTDIATGEKQNAISAKQTGYVLQNDTSTRMNVVLYNFNDKTLTGTLKGQLDGYRLDYTNSVTIPAMGTAIVPVTITPIDNSEKKIGIQKLSFKAEFDGKETSLSVAEVTMAPGEETPDVPAEGSDNASKWSFSSSANATGVSTTQGSESGTVKTEFSASANGWTSSKIDISNLSDITKSDGLVYKVRNSGDLVSDNVLWVYTGNLSYYYINKPNEATRGKWKTVIARWEDFKLNSHTVPLDSSKITSIQIGSNYSSSGTLKTFTYEVKDLGGFYNSIQKEETIEISMPEFAGPYVGGQLSNVKISTPCNVDEYKKVNVFVDDEKFAFSGEDNTVTVDLTDITKGIHSLAIVCEKPDGYKISAFAKFKVTDDYGLTVEKVSADENSVTVSYKGKAQQSKVVLIVASYDETGKRLIETKSAVAEIAEETNSIKIDTESKPCNIRIFWWRSLNGMRPVLPSSPSISFTK